MSIQLEGEGEHVWLRIRKSGFNTDYVARLLARAVGISKRNVGYAGLKDRHAETTQWFSLWLPGQEYPDIQAQLPAGIEVLTTRRHKSKLRRGALSGNSFHLVLRNVEGNWETLVERLDGINNHGVPNYYGEQRFGHEGGNIDQALALFRGQITVRDRHRRGLYISAARAWLFNQVLAERVARKLWDSLVEGDCLCLNGSRSFFQSDDVNDDDVLRRLVQLDIHPSGPLWGRGQPATRHEALQMETAIACRNAALCAGLESVGLKQERRPLRMPVADLSWSISKPERQLELEFVLPPGSYATAVVREIVQDTVNQIE